MMRINIIGTSGSGKTTLARHAARRLGLRHIELDELNWGPNWTERPHEVFDQAVLEATQADAWVMCGNYGRVRGLILPRVQVLVWLDFPLWLVLWRVVWRSVRRSILREPLWADNRESLRKSFFSRDSIILWSLTTHARRRRQYAELFSDPRLAHIQRIRLRTPQQAEAWLRSLPEDGSASSDRLSDREVKTLI